MYAKGTHNRCIQKVPYFLIPTPHSPKKIRKVVNDPFWGENNYFTLQAYDVPQLNKHEMEKEKAGDRERCFPMDNIAL